MELYFNSILTISVIGGIITCLLPQNSKGLKKYVQYIVGLICTITLLSPLTSVIGNISGFKNNISDFFDNTLSQDAIDKHNDLILNAGVEKVGEGIKSVLIDKFKFDENDITVKIITNTNDISAIKISKIIIILKNKATWENPNNIKDYLEGMISCEIEIKKI